VWSSLHLVPIAASGASFLPICVDMVHSALRLAIAVHGHQLLDLIDNPRPRTQPPQAAVRCNQTRLSAALVGARFHKLVYTCYQVSIVIRWDYTRECHVAVQKEVVDLFRTEWRQGVGDHEAVEVDDGRGCCCGQRVQLGAGHATPDVLHELRESPRGHS
jgi:hypothetical protein